MDPNEGVFADDGDTFFNDSVGGDVERSCCGDAACKLGNIAHNNEASPISDTSYGDEDSVRKRGEGGQGAALIYATGTRALVGCGAKGA